MILQDWLAPHLDMLVGRVSGPLAFRFILQPLVAGVFATRAALRDVRAGRPPYGWAVFTRPGSSHALLREKWADVANVFFAALGIDVIYQIVVLRWFYPGQALVVATVLALLPYPLIRGVLNRVIRNWYRYLKKGSPE